MLLMSHVAGAVFVDWTVDIVDPSDPVPMQVAAPEGVCSQDGGAWNW